MRLSGVALRFAWLAICAFVVLAPACAASKPSAPRTAAEEARALGASSSDPETVGRWLLAEMISPGGDPKRALEARKRLDVLEGKGLYASLARGVDDDLHGHPAMAVKALVEVLRAARNSDASVAPLAAWYAAERILTLRDSTSGIWSDARSLVETAIESPGSIGWRARAHLVEWWALEAYGQAERGLRDKVVAAQGCQKVTRIAGPFGRGVEIDTERSFEAEQPGVWPTRFRPDPERPSVIPHVQKVERQDCEVHSTEPMVPGVYYAEVFVDLPAATELVLAAQGARKLWVDDTVVLDRSPRKWGTWLRFGVHLQLGSGRHRIVGKLDAPRTSIRLLHPDGTPLAVTASDDSGPPVESGPPVVVSDPNVLDRYVRGGDVVREQDDVTTYLASYLAHVDAQDDVGSVLLEPLVKSVQAAGPAALALQALLVQNDPVFPSSDARDLARELYGKAASKDAGLWQARAWLAGDAPEKKGLPNVVRELRGLWQQFPEVAEIAAGMSDIYQQLGWRAEQSALVQEAARRYPRRKSILRMLVDVLDDQGKSAEADATAARLLALDPDSTVTFDRALQRKDFKTAVAELKRMAERRPDRKDIAAQLESVMARAATSRESFDQLERALAKNPRDAAARLALADAHLARGEHAALREALAEAIRTGAPSADLAGAIELLEGRTELEPYRVDARKVIDEFVRSGGEMAGTAVRVLDYGVLWVHPDASMRMLEHEIVRVQSREAVEKMAEQNVPSGLVLRIRVIKQDGRVLEPEFVMGKPTVTMPHLEVGDYIETESVQSTPGDGMGGMTFKGPHWFFREHDIGYWRSEFVVISPKDRPLVVERHGSAPDPVTTEDGITIVRRWRVDQSEAAVVEPGAVPIQELLPSVRVGWGVSLRQELRRLSDMVADRSVPDPRLRRIAEHIVEGVPPSQRQERARRIYRWVVSNVEKGKERDGRRIVVGKSGEPALAFLYLVRLLGIPAEIVVVRDRLAEPPVGPIADAEAFRDFVIRLETDKGDFFLSVRDKFAPFGYLPAELRGQPGYRLVEGSPRVTTSKTGTFDGMVYEGTAELKANGAATIELSERFVGKLGIGVRRSLEALPKAQLHYAIESKLLAVDLPGASLVSVDVQHQEDLDQPLTLRMKVVVPDFASRRAGGLVISPPFSARMSRLAILAERKTTLLIGEASRIEVRFRIKMPAGATLVSAPAPAELSDEDRTVTVRDRWEKQELVLDRVYDVPAGRIPVDRYASFQSFTRAADEATHRDILVRLP